jgi:hypothetical protein
LLFKRHKSPGSNSPAGERNILLCRAVRLSACGMEWQLQASGIAIPWWPGRVRRLSLSVFSHQHDDQGQ